jgi:hypothetical protein
VGVMPYPLEKGLFPLVLEGFFNEGLGCADPSASARTLLTQCAGPKRRLRAIWRYCSIAKALRAAKGNEGSIASVTKDNSLVLSSMFDSGDPALKTFQALMAEKWFGMKPDQGGWRREPPSNWSPGTSLGHWTGYYGNVELIAVEAFQRMLEVSLGVEHMTVAPKSKEAQRKAEEDLLGRATRVWPVYLFLTCPQPWFGAWVTWQTHNGTSAVRGQVTAVLQTPGHNRPLAPSPVDWEGDLPDIKVPGGATRPNPYYLHGVDPASSKGTPNSGYEGPYIGKTGAMKGGDPVAATKDQGMWLITHENHDSTIVWSNFHESATPNWGLGGVQPDEAWDLPPIVSYRCATLAQRGDLKKSPPNNATLDGYFDIVVVAPASLDGGIP